MRYWLEELCQYPEAFFCGHRLQACSNQYNNVLPQKNLHSSPHIFSTFMVGLLLQIHTACIHPLQFSNPTDFFVQKDRLYVSIPCDMLNI